MARSRGTSRGPAMLGGGGGGAAADAELRSAFDAAAGKRGLSSKGLQRMMAEVGEAMSAAECDEAVRGFCGKKSGAMSFEHFQEMMAGGANGDVVDADVVDPPSVWWTLTAGLMGATPPEDPQQGGWGIGFGAFDKVLLVWCWWCWCCSCRPWR